MLSFSIRLHPWPWVHPCGRIYGRAEAVGFKMRREEDERDEKEEMEIAAQLEKPASAERETTEPPLPGGS